MASHLEDYNEVLGLAENFASGRITGDHAVAAIASRLRHALPRDPDAPAWDDIGPVTAYTGLGVALHQGLISADMYDAIVNRLT